MVMAVNLVLVAKVVLVRELASCHVRVVLLVCRLVAFVVQASEHTYLRSTSPNVY